MCLKQSSDRVVAVQACGCRFSGVWLSRQEAQPVPGSGCQRSLEEGRGEDGDV